MKSGTLISPLPQYISRVPRCRPPHPSCPLRPAKHPARAPRSVALAMFNLNAALAAGAGRPRRGLLRAFTEHVAPALVAVGSSTIITVVKSALGATESQAPSRRDLILAAMSGGMATVFAGIWVARGGPRRHDIGLLILGVAFVPFIYSVRVGDFSPELLATIFNALAEH